MRLCCHLAAIAGDSGLLLPAALLLLLVCQRYNWRSFPPESSLCASGSMNCLQDIHCMLKPMLLAYVVTTRCNHASNVTLEVSVMMCNLKLNQAHSEGRDGGAYRHVAAALWPIPSSPRTYSGRRCRALVRLLAVERPCKQHVGISWAMPNRIMWPVSLYMKHRRLLPA